MFRKHFLVGMKAGFATAAIAVAAVPAAALVAFGIILSGLTVTAAAGTREHVAYATPRSYYEARVNLAEPQRDRIRRHLADVEALLRANPPAGLTEAQARNRAARLDDLRAYREAGIFPRNLDFPDRLIPYFIDAAGVPCAMGQLIIASGHAELAEDVRRTMNNAYIAEIAAADPRLAAWADEHGMTLEEAAMVQPGYGPPSIAFVAHIALDVQGRPWVQGPDYNNLGAGVLGVRDSGSWKLSASTTSISDFCLTQETRALVMSGAGVMWPATTTFRSFVGHTSFGSNWLTTCAWQGDSIAWAGGKRGLVRLRRTSADTLALLDTLPTPAGRSDTVFDIALAAGRAWVASRNGLYARDLQTPSTVSTWDSAALGGRRVTGVKGFRGTSTSLWIGVEGVESLYGHRFSTRGVRWLQGDSLHTIRASVGGLFVLPSDTIHTLAVRDSVSAWMVFPSGFYMVRPYATGPLKVADIPAGVTVHDMAGDASGFYAGTSAGVYHYDGDSLRFIGSPVTALRGLVRGPHYHGVRAPDVRLRPSEEVPAGAVTLDGRRVGPRAAAGVYVRPDNEQ